MDIDIKLSGYRCFPSTNPAVLELRDGFTALIGLNNSGKSSLMKAIYELRDIFSKLTANSEPFRQAVTLGYGFDQRPEIGDPFDMFWQFSNDDAFIEVTLPEIKKNIANACWKATIQLFRTNFPRFKLTLHAPQGTEMQIKTLAVAGNNNALFVHEGVHFDMTHMFDAFSFLRNCFYCPSIRHATAFVPDNRSGKLYDISVGKPFIENWHTYQTGDKKSSTEMIDSLVADIQKLFRYERLQIQASATGRDILVVANGKSLRLSDLGTGIGQFIVLLGNVAFQQPSWVLIDEPETNLHPALQLQFMQALAVRAKFGVVFATHSLGLARQVAQHIFTLSQRNGESIVRPIQETTDLAQLIGELSFGRLDFSARKVLLVEGQTDVLVFEALLSIVNKEHEFAILALGGRSGISAKRMTELEHILALNLNVVAVIDSEKDSGAATLEQPRSDFEKTCATLGINCHVLERRSIENYFTTRAIHAALSISHHRELGHFEALGKQPHHWPKRDNWRIARMMRIDEIEHTDLGEWLRRI
jgi:AAA domain, putative AbiEii toxin, Type IV TA system